MAALESLEPDARVEGLVVGAPATVIAARWYGDDTVEVVFEADDGVPRKGLLSRSDEPRLRLLTEERPWSFDADGELFRLVSEARRIQLSPSLRPVRGGGHVDDRAAAPRDRRGV